MRAPASGVRITCGSRKNCRKLAPSMVRREEPTASSRAALANSTEPSPRTTATRVASRSKDWKRDLLVKPSLFRGGAAAATELAFESGDVFFIPFDRSLQVGDAIEVFLVVAVLGAQHLGFAGVVFLLQVGLARLRLLQLRLEDVACFGVTRLLVDGVHLLARAASRLRRGSNAHVLARAIDLGALHHRDV